MPFTNYIIGGLAIASLTGFSLTAMQCSAVSELKGKNKELTEANESLVKAREAEAVLRSAAEARAASLDLMLSDSRRTLADREDFIGELIRRQPKDTQTIIREGDNIAKQYEGDSPWIRYAWPSGVRDWANGEDTAAPMPASAENGMGGHYPRSNP